MKRKMMNWLSGIGGGLLTPRGDDVPLERALDLPQRNEIWECAVRRARAWIGPPDRTPFRPWIIITVSRDGRVRGTDIIEEQPSPPDVINALARAMCQPAPGSGGKRRPTSVYMDDAGLAEAVAPELETIGVGCRFWHTLREVDRALDALGRFLGGEQAIQGLLETPGVTPFIAQGLFEAAASFYREAPWHWIDDMSPIEIRYPLDSEPRYAAVMGHGGEAYGLAIYRSLDTLRRTYAGTPVDQLLGQDTWTALLFGEAVETPFGDLDAIETYDWPVAGKYAYPLPLEIGLSGVPTRPGASSLQRFEAALLAIPRFVTEHMRAHEGLPDVAEATLKIEMAQGEDQIHLRYPVPGLEVILEFDDAMAADVIAARARNEELLDAFEQWLRGRAPSTKEISTHLDNVGRFAVHYMVGEGGARGIPRPVTEAVLADVDEFLADWLPYRVDRGLLDAVRSHIDSLETFYVHLREAGQMPAGDCDEILTLLHEDREYYLELADDLEGEPFND